MKKTTALHFWHDVGKWIYTDASGIRLTNPAFLFQADVESGKYNATPENQYMETVSEAEELDRIWDGKKLATPDKVIRRALLGICEQKPLYDKLVCTLVTLMSQVNYSKSALIPESPNATDPTSEQPNTPAKIYDILSARVFGQEAAKRAASMIVFNHKSGIRSNSVFIGPSGCGKSEIWRTLSTLYPEIVIFDGTALVPSGWRGSLHWSTIFSSIPPALRSRAILVCDEADKLMEPMVTSGGSDYSRMVQNTFLKVMDGDVLTLEPEKNSDETTMTIDCSHISVVLLGAFERLLEQKTATRPPLGFGRIDTADRSDRYDDISTEDLISHGHMRREIAGRIDTIVKLHPMDKEEFSLLLDGTMSPVVSLSKTYKRKISISDDLRDKLAAEACESGLGVRLVRSRLKQMIDTRIFEDPMAENLILDVEDFA